MNLSYLTVVYICWISSMQEFFCGAPASRFNWSRVSRATLQRTRGKLWNLHGVLRKFPGQCQTFGPVDEGPAGVVQGTTNGGRPFLTTGHVPTQTDSTHPQVPFAAAKVARPLRRGRRGMAVCWAGARSHVSDRANHQRDAESKGAENPTGRTGTPIGRTTGTVDHLPFCPLK